MSTPETSEQIATRIVAKMNAELDLVQTSSLPLVEVCGLMATMTCKALREAMAAEREACLADVLAIEGGAPAWDDALSAAVAALRARATEGRQGS